MSASRASNRKIMMIFLFNMFIVTALFPVSTRSFRVLQSTSPCDPSITCGENELLSQFSCTCICLVNMECQAGYSRKASGCGCECSLTCESGMVLETERCVCQGVQDEIREIENQIDEINGMGIMFDEEDEDDDER